MLWRRFSSKQKTYSGDAEHICEQVIADCWNGTFFQASSGHFSDFWMRDFGLSVQALLKLGWKAEVEKTLAWALQEYIAANSVTTTLQKNKAWDFPTYAPDSLAFLLHALDSAKQKKLVIGHKDFLEQELERFAQKVIDPVTGLVGQNTHFSSLKDNYIRNSSCYDNVMIGLVAQAGKKLGLHVSFMFQEENFVRNYWTGRYFKDDINTTHLAGDANVFPFWTGLITDTFLQNKAIASMQHAQLDKPFPLKYSCLPATQPKIWQAVFAPNYEGNSIWTHLAGCYLGMLKQAKHISFESTKNSVFEIIEKHKNVLEVFHPDGAPFKTLFYKTDEGMLWAANLVVQ